ncbi:MAG: ribulose-phosphate 3-epimerase [Bacteroidales bacterium]|jgi:ribulose-phosphate 3-epimerase|nr:ribulose-phosphate 3-epimerase [Bacteroidales bacterium]
MIAPSLLSANFANLEKDIQMLNKSEADWIHLDVMDGVFVPNISFGLPIVSTVKKLTNKSLDVHLMIVKPENYFEAFVQAGADYISFHLEASTHVRRSIQLLKKLGVKAGIVLNPHTPVSLLEDVIDELDYVLLMSVNPGYGGQRFIEQTYSKIEKLKQLIKESYSNALIQVDGGVNTENAKALYKAGADVLVAGNAVFSAQNPVETIAQIRNAKRT